MSLAAVYDSADYLKPSDGEPIRSVITQTEDAITLAWTLAPGQKISPHYHPDGQEIITILSGTGQLQRDAEGNFANVKVGDVVIANRGEIHGIINNSTEPLVFIAIQTPASLGKKNVP